MTLVLQSGLVILRSSCKQTLCHFSQLNRFNRRCQMHTNINADKTGSLPLKPSSRLRNNVIFVGGRGSRGPDGAERRTWVERNREGSLTFGNQKGFPSPWNRLICRSRWFEWTSISEIRLFLYKSTEAALGGCWRKRPTVCPKAAPICKGSLFRDSKKVSSRGFRM